MRTITTPLGKIQLHRLVGKAGYLAALESSENNGKLPRMGTGASSADALQELLEVLTGGFIAPELAELIKAEEAAPPIRRMNLRWRRESRDSRSWAAGAMRGPRGGEWHDGGMFRAGVFYNIHSMEWCWLCHCPELGISVRGGRLCRVGGRQGRRRGVCAREAGRTSVN